MERHVFVLIATLLAGCASAPPTQVAEEAKVDRNCVRETGTRLEKAEGECVTSPGRVYTREDLERSGGASTGDALRRVVR